VVSGCFVSRDPETAQALGADLVVPNVEKPQIAALIREALGERVDPLAAPPEALWGSPERYLLNSRVRAFLKVQDGCNAGCAYCIIPKLRGRERSRPAEDALNEAEALLKKGVREIVLTGVRLGSYSGHERGLAGLVEDLVALGALVRLSSIEPEDTDERLIEAIARHAPRVRPHLHLSLQTGSERLLGLMNRRYSLKDYKHIVRLAYEKIPDFALTTDVIAGLPTETEEDFEKTLAVLQELKPARVHVFTYTPRPGTRAARLPQLPHEVKKSERGGSSPSPPSSLRSASGPRSGKPLPCSWSGRKRASSRATRRTTTRPKCGAKRAPARPFPSSSKARGATP